MPKMLRFSSKHFWKMILPTDLPIKQGLKRHIQAHDMRIQRKIAHFMMRNHLVASLFN